MILYNTALDVVHTHTLYILLNIFLMHAKGRRPAAVTDGGGAPPG